MMREEISVLAARMETDSKEAEAEEVPEVASEDKMKVEEVDSEVSVAASEETTVVVQEEADLMKEVQGVVAKTFSLRKISLLCSNEQLW